MGYVLLDPAAPSNPKLVQASDKARWLWICGLCYSHQHKTNGVIPRKSLSALTQDRNRLRSVATLVRLNLWVENESGWSIHDYLDYQQSKAAIEQNQKQFRALRAKTGTAGPRKKPTHTVHNSTDQKREHTHDAAKTETPKGTFGHRSHVFCGRRFCVPAFLHGQFDQQLAGRGPDFDLLDWYQQLDLRDDEPVPDLFAFLREAFKAAVQDLGKAPKVDWQAFLDACPHEPSCGSAWRCDQLRQMAALKAEAL
jgi:hypothetical protein